MKIYNPTQEERAFLYQEAQDLAPLMKDLGSLTVVVQQTESEKKKSKNRYCVTFVVAPESLGMRVQATSRNLYQATIAAKDEASRQLNAIVNELPKDEKIPPEFLH